MTRHDPDTNELLDRAQSGDEQARQQLLTRHRTRLSQMVAVRLDRRLSARLDPSDVVQEALLEAHEKMSDYLRQRPLPFYPWLREIAWQRLLKMQRGHLHIGKRSVLREEQQNWALSNESQMKLANRLAAVGSSPSQRLLRKELQRRVQQALGGLSVADRELLVLRYLEQLPMKDVADILQTTEGAVKSRHTRALERLHGLLERGHPEDPS